MDKFEYAILTLVTDQQNPNKHYWAVTGNIVPSNPTLLIIINQLGQLGWEAVAIGDLGASAQPEVLLKKRVA
jgi:hypothetical protein